MVSFPYIVPLPTSEVKQWEQLGKPDPLSEEMTKFVAELKASHAAAVAEHQGEPATNSWFGISSWYPLMPVQDACNTGLDLYI